MQPSNLLFLQQQVMARQQQQQRAAQAAAAAAAQAAAAAGNGGTGQQANRVVPDPQQLWLQQQRMASPLNLQQQQQFENEARLKQQQQKMQQQQRMLFLQQQQRQTPPIVPNVQTPPQPPINATNVTTELQQKNLDLYIRRDQTYQSTLDVQAKRHVELAHGKKQILDTSHMERRMRQQDRGLSIFGNGYNGYGNDKTGTHARVVYPNDKKRKRINVPIKTSPEQATKEEMLVPIRLDVENDGYKIRDTFTWNMNESTITPDQFAEITCEDLRLPTQVFASLIANSIKDQIQDYFLNASSMIHDEEQTSDNKYEQFVESKKNELVKQEQVEEGEVSTKKSKKKELRTVIKLDIIVGNRILNDQFEWDITCTKNSPESFAHIMATDLGLGGEFKTAIAHSIREQVHVYIKSLLLTGYEFGDGPIENDDLRRSFLPTINNVIRDHQLIERFTPSLIEVSDAEIAKIEKGRTRESRRKRRGVRNRKGTTLPDREPIPTYRTIFASPPEHEMTDDQFLKSMQTGNNPNELHSQRRSAMKARMNIAAEAAGVSLTSGQLVKDNNNVDDTMVFNPIMVTHQPQHIANNNADIATRPVPSKVMDSSWKCNDCGCSPFMTTIIRSGPAGDKSLCNACGLYRFKYQSIRPQNYIDKEIKNDIPHLNDWQNYMAKYRA